MQRGESGEREKYIYIYLCLYVTNGLSFQEESTSNGIGSSIVVGIVVASRERRSLCIP